MQFRLSFHCSWTKWGSLHNKTCCNWLFCLWSILIAVHHALQDVMTYAVYILYMARVCVPRASRIIWMTTAHLGIMRWICIFVSLVAVAAECSRLRSAFVICLKRIYRYYILPLLLLLVATSTGCSPIPNPNPHESPWHEVFQIDLKIAMIVEHLWLVGWLLMDAKPCGSVTTRWRSRYWLRKRR